MTKKKIFLLLIQLLIYSQFFINIFSTLENPSVYAKLQSPTPWKPWNVAGLQKLVVVCVEFLDITHSTDASIIQSRLSIMSEYFCNVSFGRISVDVTFYSDHWEQLDNTMEYYGQDIDETYDANGWQFITDSVKAWDKFVDFSDYDSLLVIHAGEDQSSYPEMTELLWRQNYCNLGRTSKKTVRVNSEEYTFWGLAYDSEFEEWGLIAHEFGHSLGLPDLYVANKSLNFDRLSLMALGDRNGDPEGTCPAPLDGFSMHLLNWLNPTTITLNSTEDIVEMKPISYNSATLLKIPLSESEYYLVEVREKLGYDNYTVSFTSVIVYIINEMKESAEGIATALDGGIVTEGSIYSDTARNLFVSFISFNSSTHLATVGLSAKLFFVDIDVPDSVECFKPAVGKVQVFDIRNNPAPGIQLNISIGENHGIHLITDSEGRADFQFEFGINEMGNRCVKIFSPYMLAGENEKEILVTFPRVFLFVAFLLATWIITLLLAVRHLRRYQSESLENAKKM